MKFDDVRKEVKKEIIKPATKDYIDIMKSGDFYNIVYRYIGSKAFKDKVKTWIKSRWADKTDQEIINDVLTYEIHPRMLSTKFGNFQPSTMKQRDKSKYYIKYEWTALHNIVLGGGIDIIPIDILKKIPKEKLTEKFMHGGSSWESVWKPTSLKDILLRKKNTPEEHKSYLKAL